MSARYVLAAAAIPPTAAPPPGIDRAAYHRALLEDTEELLDLANVTVHAGLGADVPAVLDALHERGATLGAVVSADAPDLPGLLVGKLFGACEDRQASVLPAHDGRLTGLATRLPRPGWLDGVDLDTSLDALHERAPYRSVTVGPGWRRLSKPEDVATLDPRLDGFWATRALLTGGQSSSGRT